MSPRLATLAVMSAGATLAAFGICTKPMPRLVWNASASVPIGLYGVRRVGKIAVGILVVATAPRPLATFLAARGYLPIGVPLIKPVLALTGQSVCRDGLRITVDRIAVGEALAHDSRGRRLPVWRGCRAIAPSQVFLMNPRERASFDGRYFGLLPVSAIIGRAIPVLTFGAGNPPTHHGGIKWSFGTTRGLPRALSRERPAAEPFV
jgi:conjugative transfer signal peptidase TraF